MSEWGCVFALMYRVTTLCYKRWAPAWSLKCQVFKQDHIVCVSSSGQDRVSDLMPALWQHPGPNLAPPKKMTLWDPREKKTKPFQQLSVCFGCEKSSWVITLKSMLACDIPSNTHSSTVSWRPLIFFPAPPQGHHIKSSLITVWPLNCRSRRVAGAVQNSADDYEWKKRPDDERISYLLALLCCWQSSVGMSWHDKLLLHKPRGGKGNELYGMLYCDGKQMLNIW